MYKGKTISVIIAAYNEERFIAKVIDGIPGFVDYIIVVNDGSNDKTDDILTAYSNGKIYIENHKTNYGVGIATATGYRKSLELEADIAATMNGDGQMSPDDLVSLLEPLVDGRCEYVKGTRLTFPKPKIPFIRYVGIRILTFLTKFSSGYRNITDSQCGFTAIKQETLKTLDLSKMYPYYGFLNDMLTKLNIMGARMLEVPVMAIYMPGTSKMKLRNVIPQISLLLCKDFIFRIKHLMRKYPQDDFINNKVLVVTSSFPKSYKDATARFIYEHSKIFIDSGMPTMVLCPSFNNSATYEEWEEMKIVRFRYFIPRKLEKLAYGSGILENIRHKPILIFTIPFFMCSYLYKTWLLSKNNNIICSHWIIPSGIIVAIINKFHKKRHILVIHSAGVQLLRKLPFGKLIAGFIINDSSTIVAVSNYIKDSLIDLLPTRKKDVARSKIQVLPMGINTNYYRKTDGQLSKRIPGKEHNILYLGRLVEIKGVEYLIRAMVGIENTTLIIAGNGTLRKRLEGLASSLSVNARFLGQVSESEKREWLNSATCLVAPSITLSSSRTESMPVAIMEALSNGLPIIATRVGGIPEIINDTNGILVPEKDSHALGNAIKEIISCKEDNVTLRNNAMRSSVNYDWKNIAKKYERILAAI